MSYHRPSFLPQVVITCMPSQLLRYAAKPLELRAQQLRAFGNICKLLKSFQKFCNFLKSFALTTSMLLHVVMRGFNSVLNVSQVSLVLYARLRAFRPVEHKLVEVNVLLRCALAPRFVVQATASQSNDASMSNVFSIAQVCTTKKQKQLKARSRHPLARLISVRKL